MKTSDDQKRTSTVSARGRAASGGHLLVCDSAPGGRAEPEDVIAVAGSDRIARVDHQRRCLGDHLVVEHTMVGEDHDAVITTELLAREFHGGHLGVPWPVTRVTGQ